VNSQTKGYLAAVAGVMLCFIAGFYLSPQGTPRVDPSATPTSLQDPDFAAPHKPDIDRARKTPQPGASADPLSDLTPPPLSSPGGPGSLSLWVYKDNTPLQGGAGLNHPLVQKLPFGTRLTVLQEGDEWTQVQVPSGPTGWVNRAAVADHPPPGVTGNKPEDALKALDKYFSELNARDHAGAYDQLSFDFKRDLPYKRFAEGYAGLESVGMRVVRVQTLGPESQMFYVEMITQERPRPRAYTGEYVLVLEQGQWRIAQATLREADPREIKPFPNTVVPLQPAFPDPTPEPEEE
jgi:hypothetical protein